MFLKQVQMIWTKHNAPFLRTFISGLYCEDIPNIFGEEILLASWFIDSLLAADSLIKNLQCILRTPLLNITFSL